MRDSKSNDTLNVIIIQTQKFFVFPAAILICVNLISISDFGKLSLGLILAQFTLIASEFGINQKIIIASYGARPPKNLVMTLLRIKILATIGTSLLVMGVILLFYPESTFVFSVLCLSAIAQSFFLFIASYYRSFRNYKVESYGVTIGNASLLLLIASLYAIDRANINTLSTAILVARLFSLSYSTLYFLMDNGVGDQTGQPVEQFRRTMLDLIPISGVTIFSFAYLYIDLFLIQIYLGYGDVGEYQLAFRIVLLTMIAPEIFNHLMLPRMSQQYKQDRTGYLQTFRNSMVVMLCLSLIFAGMTYLLSGFVIDVLFSGDHTNSKQYVVLLLPLIVLRFIGAPIGIRILLEGFFFKRLAAMGAAIVVGVTMNLILIPHKGVYGVIYSTITVHILLNVLYFAIATRTKPVGTSL
ncbi:oligosaccharide flippase family protein [Thalassorhabdomicrobium marinisediminis]|uniref:Polysaccharide biosynthesis protein C-terminal domain-containing protein n=1 Tax=Thalassorhabdomicrobium marinisediminis TaxID=2170577 RepID=A0A2T7FWD1_9RHOB|nr:oligosaccharide flippase family protein [Thalassorhabdomicrobium marinisediminis]PVA06480.1 hypothetical protein DC363_11320 [Thalassorhabdomicrobium marinisediminis]